MGKFSKDVSPPYYAQINFQIDVFPMRSDGSLNPDKLTKAELESYDISDNAIFGINGFSKDDCIKKIKEVLQRLKYE